MPPGRNAVRLIFNAAVIPSAVYAQTEIPPAAWAARELAQRQPPDIDLNFELLSIAGRNRMEAILDQNSNREL
jgi:hypothetical protein